MPVTRWSARRVLTMAESGTKTLPAAGRISKGALASESDSDTRSLKPLKTERIMRSAAVPMAMPATPMPEIKLITL